MFSVVSVFSFVNRAVLPLEHSPAFHAALIERTLVFAMRQRESSFSLEKILFEIALVGGSVGKEIAALSVFGSIEEIALIVCSVLPFFLSLAVRQVVKPFTDVGIVLLVIYKFSLALSHIMPHLSLVVAASTEYVSPIAMRKPVCEGAVVVGAILEEKLADAVRLVILPLSLIDGLSGLHEEGGPGVALHPT